MTRTWRQTSPCMFRVVMLHVACCMLHVARCAGASVCARLLARASPPPRALSVPCAACASLQVDGSGDINKKELHSMCTAVGIAITPREVDLVRSTRKSRSWTPAPPPAAGCAIGVHSNTLAIYVYSLPHRYSLCSTRAATASSASTSSRSSCSGGSCARRPRVSSWQ
jgi:hypothetical protein